MLWDEILTESKQTGFQPNQTLQEQLQKAVLAILSRQNAFNSIVFQGGTALRLFYGNPRCSEDLDFVLRHPQSSFDFAEHMIPLKSALEPMFPFLKTITVRSQKHEKIFQRWILLTDAEKPSQKVRLHVELAEVRAHTSDVKILSFPPLQPVVRVETPEEILADKLLALGCREYIKGRDIWDIYFLRKEKSMTPSWSLVWKKTKDYNTKLSTVQKQLKQRREVLQKEGRSILSNELKRFLPPSLFTLYQERFDMILTCVVSILDELDDTEIVHEG
ncbi:MAG: nucleotidyl transferase AbiEii/AbiGii toxin family protein [Candidatus Thermoplasmatota archaeon]